MNFNLLASGFIHLSIHWHDLFDFSLISERKLNMFQNSRLLFVLISVCVFVCYVCLHGCVHYYVCDAYSTTWNSQASFYHCKFSSILHASELCIISEVLVLHWSKSILCKAIDLHFYLTDLYRFVDSVIFPCNYYVHTAQ